MRQPPRSLIRVRMADALRMLGLARRAGAVVPGSAAARRSIRGGGARLVVMAADAARQQLDKVERAAGRRGVPTVSVADRVTLGAAVGARTNHGLSRDRLWFRGSPSPRASLRCH